MNPAPDTALPLLGGLTPAQFMRRHWQKKPLLIRSAWAGPAPLTRSELFALAAQDDVESRLVTQSPWALRQGPLPRRALPPLARAGWTLLVQGVDLHVPAAHALLRQFRFVPDARVDDVMVSWASEGGGVGPHIDSYDVFLLQLQGRRRWRVGPVRQPAFQPGLPVRILTQFEPTEVWDLGPGDMLYLPPRWGHDGVALEGDCMTCSIGFQTPTPTHTASAVLQRMLDGLEAPEHEPHYRDPQQGATTTPAAIPPALQEFAERAVVAVLNDREALALALGESLTEPKPLVWFAGGEPPAAGQGVRLDDRTRMMYDTARVFINGEGFMAAGRDATLMRRLADARMLGAADVARLSAGARALLDEWGLAGWLHGTAQR